jgi:raffinose/stachyose/melibiose transport system permease protein
MPLSRPVATVSVLAIVRSWNAFVLPLVVLTESDGWTLPLGVTNYSTQYTTDTARVLAFTSLSMVPALVFYAFAERLVVGGLTSGAVKG